MNGIGQVEIIRHLDAGETCCDPDWEAAYKRFETAEEEIAKFTKRLQSLGVDQLPRNARIVDLFCGRGGGLKALERIGMENIEGVDLSETLLKQYHGIGKLHLADCRRLPLACQAYDAVTVQGGLHHLPTLPADLDSVLSDVRRILKPSGKLFVIEPWLTPFLRIAHTIVERPLVRHVYGKGDALAEMIDRERETYEQWLGQPNQILEVFDRYFATVQRRTSWGKLIYVGVPNDVAE